MARCWTRSEEEVEEERCAVSCSRWMNVTAGKPGCFEVCVDVPAGRGLVPLPTTQGVLGRPLRPPAAGLRRSGTGRPPPAVPAPLPGRMRCRREATQNPAVSLYVLQLLQVVRISAPDPAGAPLNQSAVVDQQNDLVTFSVTSPANQTSTVLFDVKHVGSGRRLLRNLCFGRF